MAYKIRRKKEKKLAKNWFAFLKAKRDYDFAKIIKDKKGMKKAEKKAKYHLKQVVEKAFKK